MITGGRLGLRDGFWAVGLLAVALLLLYGDTVLSMVAIWSRSDTFAHGFLILPISAWLVWEKRESIAGMQPDPAPGIALLVLLAACGWLLALLVDVLVVQQLALVAIFVLGAWAILGHRLAARLWFPLFFLFFMVPMGEGLIAPMMQFTATSTVWLIQQTGIPVYREGLFFTLPSGRWSVVEACSGVRYIIASVTVGALFAYLTYTSWWRRLLFLAVSAIVPIFANTLRAYIIVMLGHMSDMKIATGADHLVYGWVFFGVVIFVLFWIGSLFREEQPAPDRDAGDREGGAGTRGQVVLAFGVALFASALGPLIAGGLVAGGPQAHRYQQSILPLPQAGWTDAPARGWGWQPAGTVGGIQRRFYTRGSDRVALEVQYADGSFDLAEVIGSGNFFVWQESRWEVLGRDRVTVEAGGSALTVHEALVRGPGGEFVAWSWYVLGGYQTANDYLAKIHQAAASLGLAERDEWRVLVVAPSGVDPLDSRAVLKDFVRVHADPLLESLRGARTGGPG